MVIQGEPVTPRSLGPRMRVLLFALMGALGGMIVFCLAGAGSFSVGPAQISVQALPALDGQTILDLPPLGAVEASTHWVPLTLKLTVQRVSVEALERYVSSGITTKELLAELESSARNAVPVLIVRILLLGLLGGLLVAGLIRPKWPTASIPILAGTLTPLLLLGATAFSFNKNALSEPTLTGTLSSAPQLLGPLEEIPQRFDKFRDQLDEVGTTAFSVYRFLSELSPIPTDAVRVLHISDLHLNPVGYDLALNVAQSFKVKAVIDTGDTTAEGTPAETVFLDAANRLEVPYIWVRGNHDSKATQEAVAALPNGQVLDEAVIDVEGITFAGFGDPTFTPGRSIEQTTDEQEKTKERYADEVLSKVRSLPEEPDVVLVHDRAIAKSLEGDVPLVLAGHGHRFDRRERKGTLFLSVGSTGGAGLESLSPESTNPRALQVLYFHPLTHRLLAVDRIDVRGAIPRFTLTRLVFPQDKDDQGEKDVS